MIIKVPQEGTTARKIYEAIRYFGEPISTEELEQLTGIPRKLLSGHLGSMVKRNQIVRVSTGYKNVKFGIAKTNTPITPLTPKGSEVGRDFDFVVNQRLIQEVWVNDPDIRSALIALGWTPPAN